MTQPQQPEQPQPPPPQPSQQPMQVPQGAQLAQKTPTRAIVAFVIGILSFFAGIIPLVGFFGIIAVVLGVMELKMPDPQHPRGLATAGMVLGGLATVGAVLWLSFGMYVTLTGSCPHVYAFDGDDYALDGDMVSGALFAGGERADLDRLEHLRAVDGTYRLRVQNDLEEVDHINQVSLLVVDHAPEDEVLPTQDGELVIVRGAEPPRQRELVSAEGDVWTLTFRRPAGDEGLLVVRGNSTEHAERAFMHYVSQMGHSIGPLLAWVTEGDCACNRTYLDEETERLGLPLAVEVMGRGGEPHSRTNLGPVGPATPRSQAVRIALPPGEEGDEVTVRLAGTRDFWSIEDVRLAPVVRGTVNARELHVKHARFGERDVTDAMREKDDQRVVLHSGERIDVEIEAPAESGNPTRRTVILSLDGFYEVDFGGRAGVNPVAIIAHHAGWTSLPEFARDFE